MTRALPPKRGLSQRLKAWRGNEAGTATIEFALMVPVVIFIFLASIEMGIYLTRQVMLERGTDVAIRAVRVGALTPVTHDTLRDEICANTPIFPDCQTQIRIEMQPTDPRNFRQLLSEADCVDREDDSKPVRTFNPGQQNQLMLVRVCALYDPLFPSTGLAARLPRQSGGAYALVTTSAYVVEP